MPTSSRTLTRLSVLMTSQEFRFGAFERAVLPTGRDWHTGTLSVVPRSLQGTDSTCSPHRQAPRRLRGTTAARACHHRIPAVWNSRTARSPRQCSQSVSQSVFTQIGTSMTVPCFDAHRCTASIERKVSLGYIAKANPLKTGSAPSPSAPARALARRTQCKQGQPHE